MEKKIKTIKTKFKPAPTSLDIEAGKVADKTLSLEERKAAHLKVMTSLLNPVPEKDFNPETFDPLNDDPDIEVKKRPRKIPSSRLPTMGMKPKELLEGQMVGMYESKQDLYLTMAYFINDLLDRIEALENKK